MPVAEQVHARPARGAVHERAFVVHAASARSSERTQLGEPAGAELLGETDQADQDFSGCLRVRQRPMAGSRRHPEEVGERRETDPAQAPFEQAAGQGRRAQRRLCQPPPVQPGQLAFQKALVEPGVVRDQRGVAGEGEEASDHGRDVRRAAQLLLPQPGQAGHCIGEGHGRIDQRLEGADELERLDADRTQLADPAGPRREPGRLQIEDDELRLLQQRIRRPRQRDGVTRADDPAVTGAGLGEQRAGEPCGDRGAREEEASRLDDRQRAALLQRFHEPVDAVEHELHHSIKANIRSVCKHLDVRSEATILHADVDAFFASVEQRDDPAAARAAGDRRRLGRAGGELRGEGVRRPDGDERRARRGGCCPQA